MKCREASLVTLALLGAVWRGLAPPPPPHMECYLFLILAKLSGQRRIIQLHLVLTCLSFITSETESLPTSDSSNLSQASLQYHRVPQGTKDPRWGSDQHMFWRHLPGGLCLRGHWSHPGAAWLPGPPRISGSEGGTRPSGRKLV